MCHRMSLHHHHNCIVQQSKPNALTSNHFWLQVDEDNGLSQVLQLPLFFWPKVLRSVHSAHLLSWQFCSSDFFSVQASILCCHLSTGRSACLAVLPGCLCQNALRRHGPYVDCCCWQPWRNPLQSIRLQGMHAPHEHRNLEEAIPFLMIRSLTPQAFGSVSSACKSSHK